MAAISANLRLLRTHLGSKVGTRIEQASVHLTRSFRTSLRSSHYLGTKTRAEVKLCSSAASEETTSPVEEKTPPSISALDIRVGKFLSCEKHPDADSLYMGQIDVGEESPRSLCSGLVSYITAEELLENNVVVLCNLRPRKMRGVRSHGMMLCASNKEGGKVAPLVPPTGSSIGERVFFEDGGSETQPAPESENKMKKKKIWEELRLWMKTDSDGVACFQDQTMKLPSGVVTCPTLPNSPIS